MATTGNTNKSISQYLHLYTGCQMSTPYGECKFLYYRSDVSPKQYNQVVVDRGDNNFAFKLDEVKLILRKLSSMTEEEAREVIFLMDTIRRDDPIKILKLNNINIPFWLGENKIARYVSFNALNPNQFTHLLSKGFDLFGLIDSGLALDKENK